ncbi:MAG: DUF1904 family protein [Candidatus Cohnella colombiensis]|uniref:DUF1904 family protein n=1 Tax=Candidatus Cohnella colombiensis TaxID=3121368 RepID=A0AA95EUK8_9BACL|nr:MAG: DUF1904 family protein [Cohnella sp.]
MPHLLIRGITPEQVRTISQSLGSQLATLFQCPADHIVLECLNTTAIFAGEVVSSFPFIEVNAFDRGKAVQDEAAMCIDSHVRSLGISEVEIAFRMYERSDYYADGKSFVPSSSDFQALQAENQRLKEELQKLRKSLQSSHIGSMSSRLRDALRE